MIASAKDLRFNISMLFDLLNKGEDITITYRGKPKAKLIPADQNSDINSIKDDSLFGIWEDKENSVDEVVRSLRKGREF